MSKNQAAGWAGPGRRGGAGRWAGLGRSPRARGASGGGADPGKAGGWRPEGGARRARAYGGRGRSGLGALWAGRQGRQAGGRTDSGAGGQRESQAGGKRTGPGRKWRGQRDSTRYVGTVDSPAIQLSQLSPRAGARETGYITCRPAGESPSGPLGAIRLE